jgi:peptidylglycine monooxygenase
MIRFVLACALFCAVVGQQYYGPGVLIESDLPEYAVDPEQFASVPEFSELQQEQFERELASARGEEPTTFEEELRIPGEKPKANDSYLCTAFRQQGVKQKSIVSFEALSTENAHHIILFICEQPGIVDMEVESWDCGEMGDSKSERSDQYLKAPPCSLASAPIYAWSHGSGNEKTELPEGVGFPVGGLTRNQFIVLQVHYMHSLDKEDYAGVRITFSNEILPKVASTLLLVTGGGVAKNTQEDFEAACVIDEDVEMHPIAFRVHTHRHGVNVSGWLVQEDDAGTDQWTLLGERSPQKPQIFEKIKSDAVIRQGDVIAARCTIKNTEDHVLSVGPTSEDEMCNFYLMYYTNGRTLSDNVCFSPGPPHYRWGKEAGLNHIPH